MKKITLLFLFGQFVIFILSFLSKEGMSLLSYINSSFYVGGLLLFVGGIIYIFRTGSFDFFNRSMRKVISFKHTKEDLESMRSPSEVFSKSPRVFFLTGIPIFIMMFIAMAFYYS
ncbi:MULTISPECIES: DUF3899 domain-containing protein [unclassified Sporosarcina]|uniref:DUF3899 domain-containing protein n=1 Tax=unclassified Sporosarcina TaxID=2647733 RepID=UPI000579BE6A|nr:DUF3899 domain-containing protein [Sporosarcina sp. ZBG7A]VDH00542.1 Uncharacterised protein [Lysinibacillus sphaericus]